MSVYHKGNQFNNEKNELILSEIIKDYIKNKDKETIDEKELLELLDNILKRSATAYDDIFRFLEDNALMIPKHIAKVIQIHMISNIKRLAYEKKTVFVEEPEPPLPEPTIWNGTSDTAWYYNNPTATEFTIMTAEELAGISVIVNNGVDSFSGKTINLGNHILLNDYSDWDSWDGHRFLGVSRTRYPSREWGPFVIGKNDTYTFRGTFDGRGFIVKGLYTYGSYDSAGLFGRPSGATIKNLGMEYCFVSITNGAGIVAGVIRHNTTIENCYTRKCKQHSNHVMGLLISDMNYNLSTQYGKVINCYTIEGQIWERDRYCAGISGRSNSMNDVIENCYSQMNVIKVGVNGTPNPSRPTNGGILGERGSYGATVYSCYYDQTTSQQTDTNRGTPLPSAQMKMQSSYVGWDFTSIWAIDPNKNNGYPYLRNMRS